VSATRPARPSPRFDYTTVGHVTVDVLEDGSRLPGGSAFYSALQASRLGRRTLILTQGLPAEIDALLRPYEQELTWEIAPAAETTRLRTAGSGAGRRQWILAWAGPMSECPRLNTHILHLAPVARESPPSWSGIAEFVGLTPQGLVRRWPSIGAEVSLLGQASSQNDAGAGEGARTGVRSCALTGLAGRCDAIVVSEHEQRSCAEMIAAGEAAGAIVAVTAGAHPTTILQAGGGAQEVGVPAVAEPGEDLGAGDVFAAAFFVAVADGLPALAAADFANAAAALRLSGRGAAAIGDRAAIESRLRSAEAAGG